MTPGLHVMGFSKDRLFQLRELLRSLRLHATASCPGRVLISFIYATDPSSPFQASYDALASENPDVRLVKEEPGSFAGQLEALVSETDEQDCLMWVVDDLVFYRDLDLR